ncbi:hypothetical protein Vafri_13771 [Volvox africanus]|uniref:Peptidase M11 gametolysin domain-containing protein n=1 Tax=Volvox africanus TaxID=51714 RepID=A0A8J4BBZ7_9CHLO|nr:hypothetical protein Vafri_13771 [Volvox africanus]
MARRCHFLAVVLAGAFFGFAWAQQQQGQRVNVTVYVEGVVTVYITHGAPAKPSFVAPPSPKSEMFYTLSERNYIDNSIAASIRVDFGSKATSLSSGDLVQAPLTISLDPSQAALLGLGSDLTSFGGRRRLLSAKHEQARRMALEFHETRRSVQEVRSLLGILQTLGVSSLGQTPKSDDPIIVDRSADKDLFIVNGQSQTISSVTFVFYSSSCGVYPSINAAKIRQWWFDAGRNASITGTLQRYYETCSYNQLRFPKDNNFVFDVDIPCTGVSFFGRYDLRKGYGNGFSLDNEFSIFSLLAKDFLRRTNFQLSLDWMNFRRKIYMFPFDFQTTWFGRPGMGQHGCNYGSECSTWINIPMNSDRPDVPFIFQELGHNIGLTHSSRDVCDGGKCWNDEVGDPVDPMGSVWINDRDKNIACLNAPQAYKAGWATTIKNGHISAFSDLRPGMPRDFVLPAMAYNKSNMLRIVTDQGKAVVDEFTEPPQRALFVSYRVRVNASGSYDSALNDIWNNRVWVHQFDDTANGMRSSWPPVVLSALTDDTPPPDVPGWGPLPRNFIQQLPADLGALTIRVKGKTPLTATVTVCRYLRANETGSFEICSDGLDNDCDGLVDAVDPDCATFLTKRSPPPC